MWRQGIIRQKSLRINVAPGGIRPCEGSSKQDIWVSKSHQRITSLEEDWTIYIIYYFDEIWESMYMFQND